MHQTLRPSRKAEHALAGLLLDRIGPGSELIVAERVDVRPTRQIGQRLFVGDHDAARLHPWDVELVRSAEFAERQQRVRDAPACQFAGELIEGDQCVCRDERLQLAVQRADHIYRVRDALSFCLDANRKLLRLHGDVVDFPRKILENQVAHLLRLLDRAQLRRQEDHAPALRSVGDRRQQPGGAKRTAEPN